jgi:hypothetical protein
MTDVSCWLISGNSQLEILTVRGRRLNVWVLHPFRSHRVTLAAEERILRHGLWIHVMFALADGNSEFSSPCNATVYDLDNTISIPARR